MSHTKQLQNITASDLYDLKSVGGEGQLVLPNSMAKTGNSQSPQQIDDFLGVFGEKVRDAEIGVHLVYANGHYFNSKQTALRFGRRFSKKISQHAQAPKNLIDKKRRNTPKAFHYLEWDALILNSSLFGNFYSTLNCSYPLAESFRNTVNAFYDWKNRAFINFDRTNISLKELLSNQVLARYAVHFCVTPSHFLAVVHWNVTPFRRQFRSTY